MRIDSDKAREAAVVALVLAAVVGSGTVYAHRDSVARDASRKAPATDPTAIGATSAADIASMSQVVDAALSLSVDEAASAAHYDAKAGVVASTSAAADASQDSDNSPAAVAQTLSDSAEIGAAKVPIPSSWQVTAQTSSSLVMHDPDGLASVTVRAGSAPDGGAAEVIKEWADDLSDVKVADAVSSDGITVSDADGKGTDGSYERVRVVMDDDSGDVVTISASVPDGGDLASVNALMDTMTFS